LKTISLKLKAFDEHFELVLYPTMSVLDPRATIVTTKGETEETWEGEHPDCFLTGELTSHKGTASMSFCDGMVQLV